MDYRDEHGRGAKARQARRERTASWNQAIRESRIVNFGETMRAYPTAEAALLARDTAIEDGIDAFVVPPELAQ